MDFCAFEHPEWGCLVTRSTISIVQVPQQDTAIITCGNHGFPFESDMLNGALMPIYK
jgi:hypothetical protein